jgi:hypothetical protein
MKLLNQIPDTELLSMVKTKAENERQLTLDVIELLREIQSRRLHLKRGFSSLHEYCVKELRYSDGAAFRRIKAMKLVEEMPEVKESIQSGSMNLSTASQLQSTFEAKVKDQKPMSKSEKIELVSLVQNQSRREVERTLAKLCPEVIQFHEKVRPIGESQVKVELVIEGDLFKKIEKLKALTSHKNKNLIQLLEDVVDQELKRRDPEQKKKPLTASPAKTILLCAGGEMAAKKVSAKPINNSKKWPKQTRYLSSTLKFREIKGAAHSRTLSPKENARANIS